jgi:hypothetical protein
MENKMKSVMGAMAIAAGLMFGASAQAAEVYLQSGTQGIGIGYAQPITSWAGVHADINGFGLSHTFSAGSMDYDGHLRLFNAGTYLDLFPFQSSSFRVTTGLIFNDDYLSGNAVSPNGNYTINGTTYNVPGSSVNAKVSLPTVMPYFGLGFGHKPVTTRGFGLTADVGVAYGKPHVSYNISPGLDSIAGQDNVNAEVQKIQSSANKYRWYPIVQVGVSYRF